MTGDALGIKVSAGRVSPARAFGRLYRKDLEALQFTLVLFSVLIAAWEVFLFTRVPVWEPGLPFGLSLMPLAFIPAGIAWEAVQSYRFEWQSGTVHFLLAAPLPGWMVAASKLAAVLTSFTVQTAVTVAGSLAILATGGAFPAAVQGLLRQVPAGWLAQAVACLAAGYWLAGLFTTVLFQASSVASHLAYRWRLPALVAALLVSCWAVWRLGGLGHFLLGWLPDIRLSAVSIRPDGVSVIPDAFIVDSGPVLGWLAGTALLFAVTAWLVEHAMEVG